MVSTFITSVCGLSTLLSKLPRPAVTQGYVSSDKSYHLHAWRLSCNTTKQQDFRKEVSKLAAAPRRIECMTPGG